METLNKQELIKHLISISLYNKSGIDALYPKVFDKCNALIRKQNEIGKPIWVVSTFRSWKEQNDLYAKGRDKGGNVVTNAKGGQSYHNYGLAFDVAFKGYNWDAPKFNWWNELGKNGEELGLIWGGSFQDYGHFEYHPNIDWKELLEFIDDPYKKCKDLKKTNRQIIDWIVSYFK